MTEAAENAAPEAAFIATFRDRVTGESRQELLAVGDYHVGGDMPADILLPDLDVPELCILHLAHEADAWIAAVTPLTRGLSGRGREFMPGQRAVLGDDAVLRYGDIEIAVEAIRVGIFGSHKAARPLFFFALSLLLVAAGGIVSQDRWSGIVGRKAQVDAGPSVPMDPTIVMRTAEAELRRRIRNVDLDHTLSVSNDGLRLLLTGRVNEEERFRLVEAMSSARTALRVPIDTEITSNVDVSGFVSAVAFEPQTYLIAKDGTRLRVGETLPDGSRIASIEPSGILIERDGIRERVLLTR